MKKFEDVVKETEEKLNLIDDFEPNNDTTTVDETWLGRQIPGVTRSVKTKWDNITTVSDQQGKNETDDHYMRRMIVKGYFDKAFAKYRNYESGAEIYFVLTNYDTNYKGKGITYTPSSSDPANLSKMLLNFAGLEPIKDINSQMAYTKNCVSNMVNCGYATKKSTNPFKGAMNTIRNTSTYDKIDPDKLRQVIAEDIMQISSASGSTPPPTPPPSEGIGTGESEKDNGYPEIFKCEIKIDENNRIYKNDKQNYLQNSLKMIGGADCINELQALLNKTDSSGEKVVPDKPAAALPPPVGLTVSMSTSSPSSRPSSSSSTEAAIRERVSKYMTEFGFSNGVWKDSMFKEQFFTIASSSEAGERVYIENICTRFEELFGAGAGAVTDEDKEELLLSAFGIPPYPYRSNGVQNFFRAILNEIPKTLEQSGWLKATENIYFVPKTVFDTTMKGSRVWGMFKDITKRMLGWTFKQTFKQLVGTFKNSKYSSQNINTYSGS